MNATIALPDKWDPTGSVPSTSWLRISSVPGERRARHGYLRQFDSLTKTACSADAPDFFHISSVQRPVRRQKPSWEFITQKPRHMAPIDRERYGSSGVSTDAPAWMFPDVLASRPPVPRPKFQKLVVGNQVMLKPVDAEDGRVVPPPAQGDPLKWNAGAARRRPKSAGTASRRSARTPAAASARSRPASAAASRRSSSRGGHAVDDSPVRSPWVDTSAPPGSPSGAPQVWVRPDTAGSRLSRASASAISVAVPVPGAADAAGPEGPASSPFGLSLRESGAGAPASDPRETGLRPTSRPLDSRRSTRSGYSEGGTKLPWGAASKTPIIRQRGKGDLPSRRTRPGTPASHRR